MLGAAGRGRQGRGRRLARLAVQGSAVDADGPQNRPLATTIPAMGAARSSRRAPWTAALAWGTAAAGVACALATAVLAVVNHASVRQIADVNPVEIVMPVGFAVVGLIIALRRRGNPVGWLFLFMAVDIGAGGVGQQYTRLAAVTHPGLPGAAWALWLGSWIESFTYPSGAASLAMLLIPDGRLISGRWRPAVWASLSLTPLIVLATALAPGPMTGVVSDVPALTNPAGIGAFQVFSSGAPSMVPWMAGLGLSVVAASAPVVRLVRARGEQRQQLKWIAYAIGVAAASTAAFTLLALGGGPLMDVGNTGATLTVLLGFGVALPVATALAIFKHRLYDVDVVISRTLVYGALAAIISAVYVGIAVGIGALVGSGGSPNVGLSILATAIVAVAFQPLRERLQRLANRLVYGRRATPYETLSEFSQRVAESYALEDVLPRMARVLAEGAAARRADVWLCRDGMLRPAASWPEDDAADREAVALPRDGGLPAIPDTNRTVPVRHAGRLLGALSVTKRSGEALTPIEDRLLADLANQAGLVLRNAGLTAELLQRLDELRASRQRLVRAQDLERRRIERDLHDGAQQMLVALKVKLGLARSLAGGDPAHTVAAIDELRADADEAIASLRDMAHGIYPPLLAERGLPMALSAHARGLAVDVDVDVDADGVARYPEQVESCVYFCCLEALQNTAKHAGAHHVHIRLAQQNGTLRFEVADDGGGFDVATMRRGAGIENMRDRVEGAGGQLSITSERGRGTTLVGELPVR